MAKKATEATSLGQFTMPTEVVTQVSQKIQEQSVIASLVPSEPETFVTTEYAIFNDEPEGEFVGEGAAKSSSTWGFEPQEGAFHKFQTTIRVSDELKWADEDNQTLILAKVLDAMARSKARGLDYGLIHGINPLTREYLTKFNDEAIAKNAQQVAATSDPQFDLDNLPAGIIDNYDVTGIALDRSYAFKLRNIRNPTTNARIYPEIGLDLTPGSIDGIKSVVSGAVAGRRLAPKPTGIQAITGDWGLVHWGFARDFGLAMIEYGDPDGLGDLKRYNQIAYRVECVFGWAVMDYDGLVVLKAATDDGGDDDGGDDNGGNDNGGDVQTQAARTTKASSK